MLTLLGPTTPYCDGLSRRTFLKIGGLSMSAVGGVGLPTILRAEAASTSPKKSRQKAVINVFLAGGPPHQDMWEIKTEAPKEIRGEFNPISTKVPGIQIGECFPRIAAMMDKFAVIRSVEGCVDNHDGYQCMTGWPRRDSVSIGGRPSIGSIVAKVQGPVEPSIPPFVGLGRSHESHGVVGIRLARLSRLGVPALPPERAGDGGPASERRDARSPAGPQGLAQGTRSS